MNNFLRAKLEENCEFQGTDNVQGKTYEHPLAPVEGYLVFYPSNILTKFGEIINIQRAVSWVGCLLFRVLWYHLMKKNFPSSVDIRFEDWGISPGVYPGRFPCFSWGIYSIM